MFLLKFVLDYGEQELDCSGSMFGLAMHFRLPDENKMKLVSYVFTALCKLCFLRLCHVIGNLT